jgi:hypothetical protein
MVVNCFLDLIQTLVSSYHLITYYHLTDFVQIDHNFTVIDCFSCCLEEHPDEIKNTGYSCLGSFD